MTRQTPWAILMCQFQDDMSAFSPTLEYYAALFTAPDLENAVTYWADVTYGELDLTGSEVFLLRLDKNKADYTGSGNNDPGRRDLVDWAKQAGSRAGVDWSRFYGVVVCMNGKVDLFGSPKGSPDHYAVCDSFSSFSEITQEMGYGYNLVHSRSVANPTDYQNPYCIMSGMTFDQYSANYGTNPTFDSKFGASGPSLCSPYLFTAGWLSASRFVQVATNGRSPDSTVVTLSPLDDREPGSPQVALFDLQVPQEVKYFVEYRRSGGWDGGLVQDVVVIHQLRPDDYAYYAGSIATSIGRDAAGNTLLPGRIYADPQFDLSVEVLSIHSEGTVTLRIASAAAVQTLSVRMVASTKLDITGGFSIRTQVMQNRGTSLRDRLVELLRQ